MCIFLKFGVCEHRFWHHDVTLTLTLCCSDVRLVSEGWTCQEGRSKGSAWLELSTLTRTSSFWMIHSQPSMLMLENTFSKNASRRSWMANLSFLSHINCRWVYGHDAWDHSILAILGVYIIVSKRFVLAWSSSGVFSSVVSSLKNKCHETLFVKVTWF